MRFHLFPCTLCLWNKCPKTNQSILNDLTLNGGTEKNVWRLRSKFQNVVPQNTRGREREGSCLHWFCLSKLDLETGTRQWVSRDGNWTHRISLSLTIPSQWEGFQVNMSHWCRQTKAKTSHTVASTGSLPPPTHLDGSKCRKFRHFLVSFLSVPGSSWDLSVRSPVWEWSRNITPNYSNFFQICTWSYRIGYEVQEVLFWLKDFFQWMFMNWCF